MGWGWSEILRFFASLRACDFLFFLRDRGGRGLRFYRVRGKVELSRLVQQGCCVRVVEGVFERCWCYPSRFWAKWKMLYARAHHRATHRILAVPRTVICVSPL